jgi:hypothetical protein
MSAGTLLMGSSKSTVLTQMLSLHLVSGAGKSIRSCASAPILRQACNWSREL